MAYGGGPTSTTNSSIILAAPSETERLGHAHCGPVGDPAPPHPTPLTVGIQEGDDREEGEREPIGTGHALSQGVRREEFLQTLHVQTNIALGIRLCQSDTKSDELASPSPHTPLPPSPSTISTVSPLFRPSTEPISKKSSSLFPLWWTERAVL